MSRHRSERLPRLPHLAAIDDRYLDEHLDDVERSVKHPETAREIYLRRLDALHARDIHGGQLHDDLSRALSWVRSR